ncbi:MAG TPA: hypothetical protein VGJ20_12210 [Xanthobacteraceae bacterium]
MASPVNAAVCAILAAAFFTLLGYALGRHLFSRALAIGAAPVLGWAVHSAAAVLIFFLIGFSPIAVAIVAVLCGVLAALSLVALPLANGDKGVATIPTFAYGAAALLALVPAAAIVPKFAAAGVYLAEPIFDHAKIAIIDAMMRQGLPPIDPIFAQSGTAARLAYYYLWHFSAAELALPLGYSGWEADIGLTWFTAFAALTLMMGLAVWLSKRATAAIAVVALAAAASLRATLSFIFGSYTLEPFLVPPNGFAGFLFQSAWVPQHLMAASCAVTAMLLLACYARQQRLTLVPTLALTVAAGFESSTYVGGVTFAIAALAATPIVFARVEPGRRFHFAAGLAAAAVLVLCLTAPFIHDQLSTVAARGDARPIIIHHFEVLGELFPPSLRRVLDWPAYWLILLPIELPASYIAGMIGLVVLLRGANSQTEKLALAALCCLAAAGLFGSWLLLSTVGDNNDLALRAVLPAAMILIVAAAAGLLLSPRHTAIAVTALGGLVLSLPDSAKMIRSNVAGRPAADARTFARSAELWDAVRHYAAPSARVANNPLFLEDLTPWPANLSWALLANRSSCFGGRELALAFAPLPAARRDAINAQFIRVFAGEGTSADVHELAAAYQCDVVVIVAQDRAWTNDPFASSPDYRLAEARQDRWRIYRRVLGNSAEPATR